MEDKQYVWAIYDADGELWDVNLCSAKEARMEVTHMHWRYFSGDKWNKVWRDVLYRGGWRVRKMELKEAK